MINAKRDNNHRTTALASKSGAPANLLIDHVTGRLLIAVQHVSNVAPAAQPLGVRDDNNVPTALGATAADDPSPIMIDNRNNNLWATITIE